MQNIPLHFKNGSFRIMQIADMQERYKVNPNTLKLINAALDRARPDLAVLTGDQVKGYALDLKNGEKQKVESLINILCKPITDRNIPFTATFGNHDEQCGVSNSEQFEMYKKLPGFVFDEGPGAGDEGTFSLSVDDRFLIYVFDTHAKDGAGGYGALHQNQIEWYRQVRDSYEKNNDAPLPAVAFQHIPTPEYLDILNEVSRFSCSRVRAYGNHKNEWYKLDPHNSTLRDFLGESPAPSFVNSGEIDAFLEKKDVKALFVGHDHNNSLLAKYKDIYLGYTQGCGFNVYGPDLNRGVRLIDIHPDGSFETKTLTYYELCGDLTEKKLIYDFYRFSPSSAAGVITFLKESSAVLAVLGAAAGGIMLIKRKNNRTVMR